MDRHHKRHTQGARAQPYARKESNSGSNTPQGKGEKVPLLQLDECDPAPLRPGQPPPIETDPHRLQQRAKQLQMGYNTEEYKNYIAAVPRSDSLHRRQLAALRSHSLECSCVSARQ